MKQLADFLKVLNKNQRIIFARATPVIVGILFIYIAGNWADFTGYICIAIQNFG